MGWTSAPRDALFADGLFEDLYAVLGQPEVIDRTSFDAFASGDFVNAVDSVGLNPNFVPRGLATDSPTEEEWRARNRQFLMCGLWTETALLQSVTSARAKGYEVGFVEGCSAGATANAHQAGIHRMVQTSVVPMSWWALVAELCPDTASDAYRKIYPIIHEHVGVDLPPQEPLAPDA
jgi:hypothetical protein